MELKLYDGNNSCNDCYHRFQLTTLDNLLKAKFILCVNFIVPDNSKIIGGRRTVSTSIYLCEYHLVNRALKGEING